MKKYFTYINSAQEGPFDLEELKLKPFENDTPIWYEGLDSWTTAGRVPELNDLLKFKTPPPFGQPKPDTPPQIKKPTPVAKSKKSGKYDLVLGIFVTLVVLSIIGGLIRFALETTPESVLETEHNYPVRFLNASGTYRENFWGNKVKINALISNTASLTTYKDVVVEVSFYSQTGTLIASERYTIYEFFPANTEREIKLKVTKYKETSSLGWVVVDASVN